MTEYVPLTGTETDAPITGEIVFDMASGKSITAPNTIGRFGEIILNNGPLIISKGDAKITGNISILGNARSITVGASTSTGGHSLVLNGTGSTITADVAGSSMSITGDSKTLDFSGDSTKVKLGGASNFVDLSGDGTTINLSGADSAIITSSTTKIGGRSITDDGEIIDAITADGSGFVTYLDSGDIIKRELVTDSDYPGIEIKNGAGEKDGNTSIGLDLYGLSKATPSADDYIAFSDGTGNYRTTFDAIGPFVRSGIIQPPVKLDTSNYSIINSTLTPILFDASTAVDPGSVYDDTNSVVNLTAGTTYRLFMLFVAGADTNPGEYTAHFVTSDGTYSSITFVIPDSVTVGDQWVFEDFYTVSDSAADTIGLSIYNDSTLVTEVARIIMTVSQVY